MKQNPSGNNKDNAAKTFKYLEATWMKMTEQASEFFKKEMEENNYDTIRFYNLAGCCHPTLTAEFEDRKSVV